MRIIATAVLFGSLALAAYIAVPKDGTKPPTGYATVNDGKAVCKNGAQAAGSSFLHCN